MEPPASNLPDSHMVRSSAAVQQAYSSQGTGSTLASHGQLDPADASSRQAIAGPQPASTAAMQPAEELAIEQEWIEKAKKVVLRTHGDPFMQNKLLSELKAQYLATRYGRAVGAN